jgi:hypothetical protein
MTQITPLPDSLLSAADDAHRMLLCCVLHDAAELHFDAKDACPGCRALGGNPCCQRCQANHTDPIDHYRRLRTVLEARQGAAGAYPVTFQDRELLAVALPEAITYRQERRGAEDQALLAAYRELVLA